MTENKYKIGILAFGSLIDNPGEEIKEIEISRIECKTPFKVEFARISSSRDNAPTLIPISDGSKGRETNAQILVIDNETSLEDAKSILWRRECHKKDKTQKFNEPKNPTSRHVLIGELENFCNIDKVIYTKFLQQDEYQDMLPENLADFAIESIMSKAGREEKDGIRYLLSAKKYGIVTEYSEEYENYILSKTGTKTLSEAIEKLDRKRKMYPDSNNASS
ncbi:hypothetical protein EMN47_20175 [Prolixibacteraceae bacterium JC049]|nr:hypothetical protein [Prolixibacteraceae bacterium JC049]